MINTGAAMICSSSSGVVSLYDLLQFYTDIFFETLAFLNRLESVAMDAEGSVMVKEEWSNATYAKVGVLKGLAEMHGFGSIADQCQRIASTLERRRMAVEPEEMRRLLGELRQRFQDDFKREYFLHLTPAQSKQFLNPMEHWEGVTIRFSKTRHNVEESAVCFALESYGAAVFHILLVAEYGVIKTSELLGVQGDKPGWGSLDRTLSFSHAGH
jgi:hypothetical protein